MSRSFVRLRAVSALVFAAVLPLTATAQPKEFAEAQQTNRAALRQCSWKSRTELAVSGEVKQVRLEQVRFDIDGRLQKTVIGGSAASAEPARQGPPGPAGALRKRVVARKTEEFKGMLGDLAALAESYAHVPPDRMKAFAARAAIAKGQGVETGSVRIQGRDLLAMGDQMTAWIDPASAQMRRVEIAALYEGRPVTIVADYRSLDSGLTYQARSILRYPQKQVEVTVETFDYTRAESR